MTLPNEVKERAAFEAWARKTGYDDRDLERSSATRGEYTWRETQRSWMTWQAARASLPPPAEPVQGMSDAVDAARYAYVRTLHPCEFAVLVSRNIAGEGKFDDLIDAARSQQSTGGEP